MIRARIIGCGAYLPEKIVTNDDLSKIVDTTDAWIRDRTGIRERRVVSEGEKTSDLALAASRVALAAAGIDAGELDMIVCCTTTPDETFPATATRVQARLGMAHGAAFDVQAVCSGFIYGLSVADNFIRGGQANTILVIGAESMSRLLDWTDRSTCVLFGDGAGAVVLQGYEGKGDNSDQGVLNTRLYSDGRLHDMLYVDGGPSSTQTTGHLRMQGKDVFRHAVTNISSAITASAHASGFEVADIDWFVPHQANKRIIEATAERMKLPRERVMLTIHKFGNTTAATIPLCLWDYESKLKAGDRLLMAAFGGGFTWGGVYLTWAYNGKRK